MFLCPIAGNLEKGPRITQHFGENPGEYKKYGMSGHNGIDITGPDKGFYPPVLFPFDGVVAECDAVGTASGYGKHVRLRTTEPDPQGRLREVVLAHLSVVDVTKGQRVYIGDRAGNMGNTGNSSGPHLHVGLRYVDPTTHAILNYGNGFLGYVDFEPWLLPLIDPALSKSFFQYPYD